MPGERVIGSKTLNRKILSVLLKTFHQIDKAACDHEHVAGIVEIDKLALPPGKAQFGRHVDGGHTSAAAEDFARYDSGAADDMPPARAPRKKAFPCRRLALRHHNGIARLVPALRNQPSFQSLSWQVFDPLNAHAPDVGDD